MSAILGRKFLFGTAAGVIASKRLLAVAAAIAMWATLQSGAVSAQTGGVGGDGYTRMMWRGTDGSISIWKLDPSLNSVGAHDYGTIMGLIQDIRPSR
jgi:hypothetical protein